MSPEETVRAFNEQHTGGTERDALLVKRLKEKLTAEQVAHVLECLDITCHTCWDGSHKCRCWDDR